MRILFADDEPSLQELLRIELPRLGHEATVCPDGRTALAALERTAYDCVIVDLDMPGAGGLEVIAQVRKTSPDTETVILTGKSSLESAIAAVRQGVFDYLTKPCKLAEIQAVLERVRKRRELTTRLRALERRVRRAEGGGQLVGDSPALERVRRLVARVAASEATVLVRGETGTGKELVARAIHEGSGRAGRPLVAVNCGALPEQLVESELFGHRRGAFTGADEHRSGLFEVADGGTLFLDEIGDMPPALQVKLLRVLQERQVRPVGGLQDVAIDVRVISATHRDLEAELSAGRFREDLYYRLKVVCLRLPGLQERREDIAPLVTHFLNELVLRYKKPVAGLAPEAMELLVTANWPGNVRQLYNVVEQSVALATTPLIPASLVEHAIRREAQEIPPFEQARRRFEREYLAQLLKITDGNVTHASRMAKRNRTEFYKLLQRHQLDPRLFKPQRA